MTAEEDELKLWVVRDYDRWGYSLNVVRALTKNDAINFVCPKSRPNRVEVEELREGEGILWCHDESPDTPWEGD